MLNLIKFSPSISKQRLLIHSTLLTYTGICATRVLLARASEKADFSLKVVKDCFLRVLSSLVKMAEVFAYKICLVCQNTLVTEVK